jgi:hypothetical protein
MYEKIRLIAARDCRSIARQVAFFIKKGMENETNQEQKSAAPVIYPSSNVSNVVKSVPETPTEARLEPPRERSAGLGRERALMTPEERDDADERLRLAMRAACGLTD